MAALETCTLSQALTPGKQIPPSVSLLDSYGKQNWTDESLRVEHGNIREQSDSVLHLRCLVRKAAMTCRGGIAEDWGGGILIALLSALVSMLQFQEDCAADRLWLSVLKILWLSEKEFRLPSFWLVSRGHTLMDGRLIQVKWEKAGNPMDGKDFPGIVLTPIFWLLYGAFLEVSGCHKHNTCRQFCKANDMEMLL